MVFNNSLKISYKGLTRKIICGAKFCYEDIIQKIMSTFELQQNESKAIQLYDEHGCRYDKDILEYMIWLFPQPQKLFFIRLDASKLVNEMSSVSEMPSVDEMPTVNRLITLSKTVNIIKDKNPSNMAEAVPVRRQNCFIGQWPSEISSNVANIPERRRSPRQQRDVLHNMMERLKHMKDKQPLKAKNIATPKVAKRSMRF